MNEKLVKAIINNNDLYEAVFKAQNLNWRRNDSICYCLEKTPPFYSNLVTVSDDWRPDEIFRRIDAKFAAENWDEWGIKDSFAVLDLTEFGFKKLFDAEWIYLKAENFKPLEIAGELKYKVIENDRELSNWKIIWDADEKIGNEIFYPQMLENPDVFFVAGFEEEKQVSGCLVNKTADVLGVSNFFAPSEKPHYWSETVAYIFDKMGAADIVGYERSEIVEELKKIGFEAEGDLTVWLKE